MPHVTKTCCLFKNTYTTEIKLKPYDLESKYKAYNNNNNKSLQPKPFFPNI